MIAVLIRRGQHQGRLRHRKRAVCDDGGRDWKNAAASQRMTRIRGHHQKLGKGRARFHPESLRYHGPADSLILDFQSTEL